MVNQRIFHMLKDALCATRCQNKKGQCFTPQRTIILDRFVPHHRAIRVISPQFQLIGHFFFFCLTQTSFIDASSRFTSFIAPILRFPYVHVTVASLFPVIIHQPIRRISTYVRHRHPTLVTLHLAHKPAPLVDSLTLTFKSGLSHTRPIMIE